MSDNATSGSERHCILCGDELTNDLDLDTGICGGCSGFDADAETWLVSYEWMDDGAEWQRMDYPVVASGEEQARRKAGKSPMTPDSYSDVSVRPLDTGSER